MTTWTSLRKLLWRARGVWIVAPSVALLVILIRYIGLLQGLEWGFFDLYMRVRPPEARDNSIVIVGIDEADIQEFNKAILPDSIYAELLQKLQAMQPRAIGLDIYRDIPVGEGEEELAEVFANFDNIIGIEKVIGDQGLEAVAPPPILKEKEQVGANDLILDSDGRVRRTLIYLSDREGNSIPSFGFYLAALYLEQEGISLEIVETPEGDLLKLKETVLLPFTSNYGGYVRADDGGYQVMLNYRGGNKYFETVSLRDVLAERVPSDWGRDRLILIGAVGESSKDSFFTPYSSSLLDFPESMAGVEVHAHLASQIIGSVLEDRPLIKTWAEPLELFWIGFWALVGAYLTWQLRSVGKIVFFSLSTHVVAALILVGSSYGAFLLGWWIPLVPPFVALITSAAFITGYIAYTAGAIRQTFGRYLNNEVVASLLESPEGLKMGGERRKITILTSDLRGFTSTSERLPPEEVVKILNFYLGVMADIITKYQGTIDEFMGDGILVLFGAPTARVDDATRAIACAVDMQLAMTPINHKMQEWGLHSLEMGIGINTGEVVVGNIGSERRTKYGVVGNQVNLTYRIESYTIGGQILVSQSTLNEANATEIKINQQKQVQPKGVKRPINIYEIMGIGKPYNLVLAQQEETFLKLPNSLPVEYTILEGKHLGENVFQGEVRELSQKSAKIVSQTNQKEHIPSLLSNVKLNLLDVSLEEEKEDIYAKVLDKVSSSDSFYIAFTSVPPEVASKLNELYKSSLIK
ncbi:MAG: adenylate/guanylate cyclase domain-containing protein [Spirulinaceae cyanobacterium]